MGDRERRSGRRAGTLACGRWPHTKLRELLPGRLAIAYPDPILQDGAHPIRCSPSPRIRRPHRPGPRNYLDYASRGRVTLLLTPNESQDSDDNGGP
jgi:hypothetical protein